MKPSLSGRADLIRALACHDPALTAAMAELLNYQEVSEAWHEQTLTSAERALQVQADTAVGVDTPYEPVDVPFWRLKAYEAVVHEASLPQLSTRAPSDPMWRLRPTARPTFIPLAPQQQVLTRLRQLAAMRRTTHEIDEEAVVKRLSQGELITDIPRRLRRAWASELYIVEDRARRLVPYWRDQDAITDVLRHIYPPYGITVARIWDGDAYPVIRWPEDRYGQSISPQPGAVVLVLGDLGCLAHQGDHLRRYWLHWGRQLCQNQNPAIALVPAQAKDIPPEHAHTWTIVPWGVAPPALRDVLPQLEASTVQHLLTLLSPVVRLEPALLRAVRCLLPEGRYNPGLEARVWQDAAIASQHSVAATLKPEERKAYRRRFAAQPEPLRRAVLELVRLWRADLHAAVWFEEIIGLDPQSQGEVIDIADLEDAETFLTDLDTRAQQSGQLSVDTAWIWRMTERLPEAPRQVSEVLHRLYNLVRPHTADTLVPSWYDPANASRPKQTPRQVTLWQMAGQLLLRAAEPSALDDDSQVTRGSPLGLMRTSSGEVIITVGQRDMSDASFWQTGRPPRWAQHWGIDAFGPWVTFRVGTVEQRLRWIPPGRFWMGSPEGEEGRWDWEGPPHEVCLTCGFWLFDTPCTQALWQAVMDTTPSQFEGAMRPVEQVSWADAQAFITELNEQLPGIGLRLPSEAQWEYACRAGTQTSQYEPDLDAIAWYAANSDGETHEVGQKHPNAWGLYDMLGNVWEWCDDGGRDYESGVVVDPVGPTDAGADRVFRGGCWVSAARFVRAADRFWLVPGYRLDALGFRCASSGASEPARATWRESEQKAEPAKTVPRMPAARRLVLTPHTVVGTDLPDSDSFYVSTDRDWLYFDRMTIPSWATEIGRDAYGLWVTFRAGTVEQRLRWIPPGRFMMGSPGDEEGRWDWEGPRHEVHLTRGFWLFDTPCTQALWQAVMGANPSRFEDAMRPVEQVSWSDAQAFIAKLNEQLPGIGLRLPTEAQWEYACRVGTETSQYGPDLDAIAWYAANSGGETHEVGQKRLNAWGLYDMLGNVWEWCDDGRRDYESGVVVDPVGPTDADAVRVFRGGGWHDAAQDVRSANRYWDGPGYRHGLLGFRCASSG